MEITPIKAAGIYALGVFLPTVVFVALYLTRAPLAAIVSLASAAISTLLFGMGARLAPRAHKVSSVLICIVLTWAFCSSLNSLSFHFLRGYGFIAYALVTALSFAFVFCAGWRLSPRSSNTVHG